MEIPRKNQKEMLEAISSETKNTFDGLIPQLDTAEEGISESIYQENPRKPKSKENKDWKKPVQNNQGVWNNLK